MSDEQPLFESSLSSLERVARGKVRDIYQVDSNRLLIIATDRISAFDSVLPCGIPDKGRVLNQISTFWFQKTENLIPNHLVEAVSDVKSLDNYLPESSRFSYPSYLAGRAMVVKKAKRVPVEAVVRGYLSGSAWAEYQQQGTINGESQPKGLRESQELPEPLFTPTTKEESGHDRPLGPDEVDEMLGKALAEEVKNQPTT